MSFDETNYHEQAEKQILKAMQPKRLKYALITEAVIAGAPGFEAGYFSGSAFYLCAGAAALAVAGGCLTFSSMRTASKNNRKLISAMNNEERQTLETMLNLEARRSHLLHRQLSEEYGSNQDWALQDGSKAWNEKPLEDQLEAVAAKVNSLLGYDIPVPQIAKCAKKGNEYRYLSKNIITPEDHPSPVTLAHEYAHHISHVKSCSKEWDLHDFLSEGFAEVVALAAVNDYALKTDDRIMQREVTRSKINCLSDYKAIFNSRHIMRMEGANDLADYCVGTTAFLVAERKHGKGIYRQMLDSKNPHGLLVTMVCGRKA
ncbi:MAG: hypothetical protein V1734_06170 [Nanoarchaeota archaeon]